MLTGLQPTSFHWITGTLLHNRDKKNVSEVRRRRVRICFVRETIKGQGWSPGVDQTSAPDSSVQHNGLLKV